MNKNGAVILIEDVRDDLELLPQAYGELATPISTMRTSAFFLIISDVNMPLLTGIELRDKMKQEVKLIQTIITHF